MAGNIKVSIIIPTYNKFEECLKPCIESILKYTDMSDKEIIVVSNGSTDGTNDFLWNRADDDNRINYHISENPLGFAKAVNAGIKMSRGEYVVILNNDTILMEQNQDDWLNIMMAPMEQDKTIGITGPLMNHSPEADRDFLVFFCVMIKREVFSRIGYLDESFGVGGGEDTDFCIKAKEAGFSFIQVPDQRQLKAEGGLMIGSFPIFHAGEATVHDKNLVKDWESIYKANGILLRDRYNLRFKLSNYFERAVIGRNDPIPPAENARYTWAKTKAVGKRILELGCSSGYGSRYFTDPEIQYAGCDKDFEIIEYAKKEFPERFWICKTIEDFINKWGTHQDTIIAFEVLEHLDNGKEIAQTLRYFCHRLLISVPYMETPGFWGPHHKLHGLKPSDFPGFKASFLTRNGEMIAESCIENPCGKETMLLEWYDEESGYITGWSGTSGESKSYTVSAEISTKGRYWDSLPMVLMGIVNQTVRPKEIIIYDDNAEMVDLRQSSIYQHLFNIINMSGISWKVVPGEKRGQVANHERALHECETDLIWRIDDDEYPELYCLENLLKTISSGNYGAVGSLVLQSDRPVLPLPEFAKGKLEPCIEHVPPQWYAFNGTIDTVEHLHSTFLFRKDIGLEIGYCPSLSVVGHREETMFTYGFIEKGYKLAVNPKAIVYHLRNSSGGIRTEKNIELWQSDENYFREWLLKHGKAPEREKLMVLNSGLGDTIVAIPVIGEVIEKHKDLKVKVFVTQPQAIDLIKQQYPGLTVYLMQGVEMILNPEAFNIYGFMAKKNWNKPLVEAYREFYL